MQLRIERRMVLKIPWGLVGVTLAIALLGIWNLASASRPPHTPLWARQLLNLGVGLSAGVLIGLMDYRFIQRMAWPIYAANAAALMALKFIGHRAKGEGSWIVLGPLRVEPAEFMKLALIIALARFFHDDYREGEAPYG
ncbi:MAG: rod shape-determining protein RodA, partial [Myxococcaceae bacterium]